MKFSYFYSQGEEKIRTDFKFILVINQLDAQNLFYNKFLFHACTCFEHYVLIVRRSKVYFTASGIITHVGGRPVHRLREDSEHVLEETPFKILLHSRNSS